MSPRYTQLLTECMAPDPHELMDPALVWKQWQQDVAVCPRSKQWTLYPKPAKGQGSAKTHVYYADFLEGRLPVYYESLQLRMSLGWENSWTEQFVVSLLLLLAVSPIRDDLEHFFTSLELFSLNIDDYKTLMKQHHVLTRSTNSTPVDAHSVVRLSDEVATHWQYLDLLVARGDHKWDPTTDLGMRIKPGMLKRYPMRTLHGFRWDSTLWNKELERTMEEMFGEAFSRPLRVQEWEELWLERDSWVASGSAPGVKFELSDNSKDVIRPNKRLALELFSLQSVEEGLNTEPYLLSRLVKKYELGKNRVLWNAPMNHYLLSCMVLEPIEKRFGELEEIDSYQSIAEDLQDEMLFKEPTGEGVLAYDFSDFNLLHDNAVQALFFNKIAHFYETNGWDVRFSAAARWLAEAFHNTWLQADDQTWGKSMRGMLTGIRATATMNTFFNVAYMRTVRKAFSDMQGYDPIYWMRCRGDDSIARTTSRADSLLMMHLLVQMGLAGQTEKILHEPNRLEYLRIDYRRGVPRQFLNRCVPNVVNGEFHALGVIDPVVRAKAVEEQLGTLRSRGALLEPLQMLGAVLGRYLVTLSVGRHKVYPNSKWFATTVQTGGLGMVWLEQNRFGVSNKTPSAPRLHYAPWVYRKLEGHRCYDLEQAWISLGLRSIPDLKQRLLYDDIGSSAQTDWISERNTALSEWWALNLKGMYIFKMPAFEAIKLGVQWAEADGRSLQQKHVPEIVSKDLLSLIRKTPFRVASAFLAAAPGFSYFELLKLLNEYTAVPSHFMTTKLCKKIAKDLALGNINFNSVVSPGLTTHISAWSRARVISLVWTSADSAFISSVQELQDVVESYETTINANTI